MTLKDHLKRALVSVPALHDLTAKLRTRQAVFGKAYAYPDTWGSAESASGRGSELGATSALRAWLPDLFQELGVTSVVDAPCGDWNWMKQVDLTGIDYTGLDIVPEVIARNQDRYTSANVRFQVADLTRDPFPGADLVICRDCTIHLSFRDIGLMIENFRISGATWLLMTNSPDITRNKNQLTGLNWRALNMQIAPFDFPVSTQMTDDNYPDEHLQTTLWRFADIPVQPH